MPEPYVYADRDDQLALTFDEQHQPYPRYWRRSEEGALRRAERLLGDTRAQILLDFGCGTGRLIPRFAARFHQAVGVEPDAWRAACASDRVRRQHLNNVTILPGNPDTVRALATRFDVVMFSHVFQHVSTHALNELVEMAHAVLRARGTLLVLTCRSRRAEDLFTKSRMISGRIVSAPVDEDQFNRLTAGDDAWLPVRHFGWHSLDTLLQDKFTILTSWVYHELSPANLIDRFMFRDRLINLPWLKNRFGHNVMVVARRREPPVA